jgi:hypothetical protein
MMRGVGGLTAENVEYLEGMRAQLNLPKETADKVDPWAALFRPAPPLAQELLPAAAKPSVVGAAGVRRVCRAEDLRVGAT